MLTTAGLQVPVIPLIDVAGSVGTTPPSQMVRLVPKLKVGVILGRTVTLKLALLTHCPGFAVKVYTFEVVLLTVAGLHVPLIPFVEVFGNVGTVPPSQMARAVPKLNTGVTR